MNFIKLKNIDMLKDIILFTALIAAVIYAGSKPEPEVIVKTIYITRDTCDTDSDFINAIGHIETQNTDSLIGDSGRAFGRYQIHDVCITGSGLKNLLNYQHKDMFDSVKAERVFWAVMGINCHVYAQKYGKYPDYGELARMWNGGPNGYQNEATLNYLKKFEQCLEKN
jgi:hypothetical protein